MPAASVALLAILMLRGAQTVSELRANCERLYRFDDASSVEAYLEEFAERSSGALVVKLPKQSGSREHRWVHLLCGEPSLPAEQVKVRDTGLSSHAALEERVARLEHELAELREKIGQITG